jgi:hypothetical protein
MALVLVRCWRTARGRIPGAAILHFSPTGEYSERAGGRVRTPERADMMCLEAGEKQCLRFPHVDRRDLCQLFCP